MSYDDPEGGEAMKFATRLFTAVLAAAFMHGTALPARAADKVLTVWSHYADHQGVRNFFKEVEQVLEKENPGLDLQMTFYEKNALFAAQTTALRAGQGPDIMYLEPDRMQFVESGFVRPLDGLVDLGRLEDFAKQAWTVNGKVYGLGMQAFTVELYYDKALMEKVLAKIGVQLAPKYQLTQSQFLAMVKAAKAMDITPIVQGIGDRPYPGSYLLHELLLRKIGRDDYAKLWAGKLPYTDPRVVQVFDYVKELVDAGAYPKVFNTLKLGESHYYFHTKPGGLTFPLGSWYSSRAFNPPDKGGQPKDFRLGIMQFPAMDGGACNDCKTIGVAGTYSINSNSKHSEGAAKFLNMLTREDFAKKWVQATYVQTGVMIDPSATFGGEYAGYLKEMAERGKDRKYFIGTPIDFLRDQCKETYIQVLNAGFPGGLLGTRDAVQKMQGACYKG
jgi:multiple sugar transport system substrate-binding protein